MLMEFEEIEDVVFEYEIENEDVEIFLNEIKI